MALAHNLNKHGECEYCGEMDKELFPVRTNEWMCQSCIDKEASVVVKAQHIDSTIQTKGDVFVSQPTPIIELRAAVMADDAIPADQKELEYTKVCRDRMQNLQKAIFEAQENLLKMKEQEAAWRTAFQTAAGNLRLDLRAQFVMQDMNYQPPTIKKDKVKKAATQTVPKKKYNKQELFDAAKKYNLEYHFLEMTCKTRNCTAEEGAKYLVDLYAKVK